MNKLFSVFLPFFLLWNPSIFLLAFVLILAQSWVLTVFTNKTPPPPPPSSELTCLPCFTERNYGACLFSFSFWSYFFIFINIFPIFFKVLGWFSGEQLELIGETGFVQVPVCWFSTIFRLCLYSVLVSICRNNQLGSLSFIISLSDSTYRIFGWESFLFYSKPTWIKSV